MQLKPNGGEYRIRTGVHGFAVRCVASPPTRPKIALSAKGKPYMKGHLNSSSFIDSLRIHLREGLIFERIMQ